MSLVCTNVPKKIVLVSSYHIHNIPPSYVPYLILTRGFVAKCYDKISEVTFKHQLLIGKNYGVQSEKSPTQTHTKNSGRGDKCPTSTNVSSSTLTKSTSHWSTIHLVSES